jgi:4-diphosphocytidyl-2-C-methyl-D-erythritol kinase
MLTIQAPAKLNLTLEVLSPRSDGYHEIRSIIQTINLCDSLSFQLSQKVEFRCDLPAWSAGKSLVSRATGLLKEVTGSGKGVTIEISKHIPLVAGLGGDSSDAAATLQGLNALWELGLTQEKLVELASGWGSDVGFFLYGGTALVKGRGEMVTPLPSLSRKWVVLMFPSVPLLRDKTKQLYASLKPEHYSRGEVTDRLVARLTSGEEIRPSDLFNVFDSVAASSFAGFEEYRGKFLDAGAQQVHLAGSGPTLFSLLKDRSQAEKIYRRLKEQGLESHLGYTLN